jgi:hypothetical protein
MAGGAASGSGASAGFLQALKARLMVIRAAADSMVGAFFKMLMMFPLCGE